MRLVVVWRDNSIFPQGQYKVIFQTVCHLLSPSSIYYQTSLAVIQLNVIMSNHAIDTRMAHLWELVERKGMEITEPLLIVQTQMGEAKRVAGWQLFHSTVGFSTHSMTCK